MFRGCRKVTQKVSYQVCPECRQTLLALRGQYSYYPTANFPKNLDPRTGEPNFDSYLSSFSFPREETGPTDHTPRSTGSEEM